MPVITVTLIDGEDETIGADLSRRLRDTAQQVTGVPAERVTVIVNATSPEQLVRDYLAAMEARDLETAAGFLGDGFTMIFPGDQHFSVLEQLTDWARARYRSIAKTYQRFDEAPCADGAVVYCFGTLSGEWLDGTAFADIRFIDRFTIVDGKIIDQQVWNDLAETRR